MIDYIDVTPMEQPDPDWLFTDAAGHVHRWDFSNPAAPAVRTIRLVTDADPDDEHPGWHHHECRMCGAHVQRGMRVPQFREFMAVRYS